MSAEDIVTVELIDGNIGDHPISFGGQHYGYRHHGERFKMARVHAELLTGRVRIVTDEEMMAPEMAGPPRSAPPPPKSLTPPPPKRPDPVEPDDLTGVWGIGDERVRVLAAMGVRTYEGFSSLGVERVMEVLGVVKLHASRMVKSAEGLQKKK